MTPSEPREDAVAGHVAVLEMYMRERCEHPEDEPAFRAAIAALAQQGAEPVAWRCVIREHDDGGIATTTMYAKTRQEMLIYQDQGYTCTQIPATGAPR